MRLARGPKAALLLLLPELRSLPDILKLLPVLVHAWWQELSQVCCLLQQLAPLLSNDGCMPRPLSAPVW